MILWIYLFKDKYFGATKMPEDISKLFIYISSSFDYQEAGSTYVITTEPIEFYKYGNRRPEKIEGCWSWVIDIDNLDQFIVQHGVFNYPLLVNCSLVGSRILDKDYQKTIAYNNLFIKEVLKEEFQINYFINLIFNKKHFNIIASTSYYLYSDALIVQKFIKSRSF